MSQEQDSFRKHLAWLRAQEVRPEDLRRQEQFDNLKETLGKDGFEVNVLGLAAPVQLSGYLPTGEPFYFRSRGDVRLEVGKAGDRPFDDRGWGFDWPVVWAKELDVAITDLEGSWLEASEVESYIRELHQQYLDRAPSQSTS